MIARLIALLLLLLPTISFADDAKGQEERKRWIAFFEQSYGSEGLYVVETNPTDPAAANRLALQRLNATVTEYLQKNPGKTPTVAEFRAAGLIDGVQFPDESQVAFDASRGFFSDVRGGPYTPQAGTVMLLSANQEVRKRILSPDKFTRQRWKKLYQDPACPQFLKREIELREYLLANYEFPEARLAENLHRQLVVINNAIQILAITNEMKPGDAVTLETLQQKGLVNSMQALPKGVSVVVKAVGETPYATVGDMRITTDMESVRAIRKARMEREAAARKDYPPTLVLRARFAEPAEAQKLLTQASSLWPDVAGVRAERLAAFARAGAFDRWTIDLDFLLKEFPAAPLLIELESAAEYGGVSKDPKAKAQIATLLADIRPDLLAHQVYAIRALLDVGDRETARTIFTRLQYANPAWRPIFGPLIDPPAVEVGEPLH